MFLRQKLIIFTYILDAHEKMNKSFDKSVLPPPLIFWGNEKFDGAAGYLDLLCWIMKQNKTKHQAVLVCF